MIRAERARGIAVKTALGGGGLAVAGLVGVGLLHAQVAIARRVIGDEAGTSYHDGGSYGAGIGDPYRILVLGDSTASGVGAGSAKHTVGAIVATGVAALTGRPVRLRNVSRSGATSPQLLAQADLGLAAMPEADVAVIMIGSNDVKERIDRAYAVRCLAETVTRLRQARVQVVVGTCPDLGTIRPIPQPLRALVQRWSRELAEAQTVAVVEVGGRTVSTGDLLGPEFRQLPTEMFSEDRFHPSAAGYARAAAALLPSVCDALGLRTIDTGREPDHRRGEWVEPLPQAAHRAVKDPGSEVSATSVDGRTFGDLGRWATLLRRHRTAENLAPASDASDRPAYGSAGGPTEQPDDGLAEHDPAERDDPGSGDHAP